MIKSLPEMIASIGNSIPMILFSWNQILISIRHVMDMLMADL